MRLSGKAKNSWHRIRSCLLPLACAMVSLLALPGSFGSAAVQAPNGWSTPVNLSQSDTASLFPDIAVDDAGHVYVVWGEFASDHEGWPDLLMFRLWDGQAWSPANDIALGGHLPQIGVDSRGRLYAVTVGPYVRAWAQGNPSDAKAWVPGPGWALRAPYWPDMVTDSQDRIHIVFRDTLEYDAQRTVDRQGECVTGCRGIFYVRSVDGGDHWSSPTQLDMPDVDAEEPRLTVDSQGRAYAVWIDTSANEARLGVSFAVSADGGASWSISTLVVRGKEGYAYPSIAVDSAGTIHIMWHYLDPQIGGLGYTWSADGGSNWSQVEHLRLPATGAYWFGLAMDSADTLHLAVPLASGEFPSGVYHLARRPGGPWSPPAPIAQNSCSAASSYVQLAVSQGNHLHAVWYDREECRLGFVGPFGRGEVFYSTFTSDAPVIPSAPLPPRPTPGVTPTVTSTALSQAAPILPMPSPISTLALTGEESPTGPPSWYPGALGAGLAGGVILLVVIWQARARRSWRGR